MLLCVSETLLSVTLAHFCMYIVLSEAESKSVTLYVVFWFPSPTGDSGLLCYIPHGIRSEDKSEFNTIKVRIFLQREDKNCVLTLWYIAMICTHFFLSIGV